MNDSGWAYIEQGLRNRGGVKDKPSTPKPNVKPQGQKPAAYCNICDRPTPTKDLVNIGLVCRECEFHLSIRKDEPKGGDGMSENMKELDPRTSAEKRAFQALCAAVKQWGPIVEDQEEPDSGDLAEWLEEFINGAASIVEAADCHARALAKQAHEMPGYIEIDANGAVRHLNHGAFVAAWVWIALPKEVTE